MYVKQPPDFESFNFPKHVFKLKKALYGLKQGPRAWYERLTKYLLENGFKMGKIGTTLCWDWAPKSKTWSNKVKLNYPLAIPLVYWHLFEYWAHFSYIVHDLGALGVAQKIQVMGSL